MSSAYAALESDTRVLVFEAGRKGQIRVNTISAGPLGSRAAKAIGFIEKMIDYSYSNAPLQKELLADEVGNTAAFFVSPLASAVTGSVVYVDNGLNTMGLAIDSPTLCVIVGGETSRRLSPCSFFILTTAASSSSLNRERGDCLVAGK
ncbi:enoyl-[acyl-carrier-protein] reductase [NADH] 1, chloroplastic-like isoform X2 [Musa acuminata AAA Group]